MEQRFKNFPAAIDVQPARRIRVIASTPSEDREGDIIEVGGWDLSAFRRNPVILFNHSTAMPIGRCIDIGAVNGRLEATIEFPPPGTSEVADRVYGLVRHGSVSAVSVGFIPRETTPNRTGRGLRITRAELLELSLVSVPANPECLVVQRDAPAQRGTAGGRALRRADVLGELRRMRMMSELEDLRRAVATPKAGDRRRAELEQLRRDTMLRKQIGRVPAGGPGRTLRTHKIDLECFAGPLNNKICYPGDLGRPGAE